MPFKPRRTFFIEQRCVKYYPQIALATPLTLAQITRHTEKHSTVSNADVKAVLDALQVEVLDTL